MNFKLIIYLIFFCVLTITAKSQNITINTDRPDQSDGVSTVPLKKFQLEEGFIFAKEFYINNLMIRYGLANSTEIRLLFSAGKEFENKGLLPLSLSLKQKITNNNKLIPAISFVGYLSYGKFASKDFQINEYPFELKLAFENEVSPKFSMSYNIGTFDNFNNLGLSFNLGFTPIEKISTFIEYFSSFTKNDSEHNIDFGVLYLINPFLQVDFALGHSIFAYNNRFFSSIGISYLFN